MDLDQLKTGDEIFYGGSFYEVAEVRKFPHAKMIGIYDDPPTRHVDYLNPSNVNEVYPCNSCQGGGCPVCAGYGRIIGSNFK